MLATAWRLVRLAASAWVDDYAASMGAALAFYTLFSIAPLLLIVVAVAGLVFGQDAARGEIFVQLSGMLGDDAAKAIESILKAVNRPGAGIAATVVGLVALLIGATTVFAELQDAMDRIWRAPTRPKGGVWAFYSHEHGSRRNRDVTPANAAPVPQRDHPGPDGLAQQVQETR